MGRQIKYNVWPGYVRSKNDGQTHYIGPGQLMRLYNVSPSECVIRSNTHKGLIDLKPSYEGNYSLEEYYMQPGLIDQFAGLDIRPHPLVPPYTSVDDGPAKAVRWRRWNSNRCYRVRVQKKFDKQFGRKYRRDINIYTMGGTVLVAPEIYEMIKNQIGN